MALVAACGGDHADVLVDLVVECAPPVSDGHLTFPPLTGISVDGATVRIVGAENASFAFAWRCVRRAVDAVSGRRQVIKQFTSSSIITLLHKQIRKLVCAEL